MTTLAIAVLAFVGYIVAYHTYGRWLARRIFKLDPEALVPSRELRDNMDYIPTKKQIIFGHHFTSIAGTGPIVGPAIAVFWGWLPALAWIVFGGIFMGAVHDFAALVISMRNRGQTVGEIAGRIISPRARILFLLILFFALTTVIAIFGLVIASIFKIYPESVLSVWVAMPVAIMVGFWVNRRGGGVLVPSLLALMTMYFAIYLGAYWLPIALPESWGSPVVIWTAILLVYCYAASVLPVWMLLQPRDYVNSHQLVVALLILLGGIGVAGVTGQADLLGSAPAVVGEGMLPQEAPPIFPFLFITVACGAISGFHCLVSSGTSSKQLACEPDAQYVGYGSMLLESGLAVIVVLACCAGVGMGKFDRVWDHGHREYHFVQATVDGTPEGKPLVGQQAWQTRYDTGKHWNDFRLGAKVGAFVDGGANFISTTGMPLKMAVAIMAVLVASFAATTLDTATRLQRYVIQELATTVRFKPLGNKYAATLVAVALGGALAMVPGTADGKLGTGGLILWPLFGAVNQLLAGLALMVAVFYLWRRNKPVWFVVVPMLLLIVLPAWAMFWKMFNPQSGWYENDKYLLLTIGGIIVLLQAWLVFEGLLVFRKAKGVLEEPLPPLDEDEKPSTDGGRSC